MNALLTWLPLILIPLIAQYTVAPIIIRFINSHPASPEFEPVNIAQLPPDVAESFNRFVHAMSADGFLLVGYFRQLAYMRGVGFHLALLKNPATADIAYIIEMFANNGGNPLRSSQLAFCTEFSDGTEISTNNGQYPSIHKATPEMKVFRFPEINNPHLLYQIHRRLCARMLPGVKGVALADGLEVFRLSYDTVKEVRKQAEFGYYYLDDKAGVFRPTWKGAYVMTWKLAWPVGSVRKARMRSRARATMRTLGFAA